MLGRFRSVLLIRSKDLLEDALEYGSNGGVGEEDFRRKIAIIQGPSLNVMSKTWQNLSFTGFETEN